MAKVAADQIGGAGNHLAKGRKTAMRSVLQVMGIQRKSQYPAASASACNTASDLLRRAGCQRAGWRG